jgi:hypothetical protein
MDDGNECVVKVVHVEIWQAIPIATHLIANLQQARTPHRMKKHSTNCIGFDIHINILKNLDASCMHIKK